jgi:hypothetical protein
MIASQPTRRRVAAVCRTARLAVAALRVIDDEQVLMWELFWQSSHVAVDRAGPLAWQASLDGPRPIGSESPKPHRRASRRPAARRPGHRTSGLRRAAGSGGDEVFGGLAAGVEVPVEACDVVGFLEWGAFGGAWRACDPCADRDMAGINTPAGQCTVEGEGPFA